MDYQTLGEIADAYFLEGQWFITATLETALMWIGESRIPKGTPFFTDPKFSAPDSHVVIFIAAPLADSQYEEAIGTELDDDLPIDIFIRIGTTRINEFVEALRKFSFGFLANFEYEDNLKEAIFEQEAQFSPPEKRDTTVLLNVRTKLESGQYHELRDVLDRNREYHQFCSSSIQTALSWIKSGEIPATVQFKTMNDMPNPGDQVVFISSSFPTSDEFDLRRRKSIPLDIFVLVGCARSSLASFITGLKEQQCTRLDIQTFDWDSEFKSAFQARQGEFPHGGRTVFEKVPSDLKMLCASHEIVQFRELFYEASPSGALEILKNGEFPAGSFFSVRSDYSNNNACMFSFPIALIRPFELRYEKQENVLLLLKDGAGPLIPKNPMKPIFYSSDTLQYYTSVPYVKLEFSIPLSADVFFSAKDHTAFEFQKDLLLQISVSRTLGSRLMLGHSAKHIRSTIEWLGNLSEVFILQFDGNLFTAKYDDRSLDAKKAFIEEHIPVGRNIEFVFVENGRMLNKFTEL